MGRLARIEVDERREAVLDMMLLGKTNSHIKSFIMNRYNVGLSTVEHDLTIVYQELREFAEKEKTQTIEKHIARYEKAYAHCMETGNVFVALKALKQKEELLQLHKGTPLIAVQNNNMSFDNLSVEEIEKLLNGIKPDTENNQKGIT